MIDFISNNLEYLAIPLVVGGIGLIVKGLISTPVATPNPGVDQIKTNVSDIVQSNNTMLDSLKTALPNSRINDAIEGFKVANTNELGVIHDRLDLLASHIITNPVTDLGFNMVFLGIVTLVYAFILLIIIIRS